MLKIALFAKDFKKLVKYLTSKVFKTIKVK